MRPKQIYRSDRQIERQTNILHAARKLAGRVGYDGLTMRELADRAGVSPKTLYNLFHSKDDLLIAAVQDLIGIIRRTVRDHTHLNGIDYILAVRRSGSEAIVRSPGFANVIVSLFLRAKPEDRLVASLVGGSRAETVEHLRFEQSRGSLVEGVDADALAFHLFAQSWSTLLAWDKGLLKLDEIVSAEQFSYIVTLLGVTTERKRRELQRKLVQLQYRPSMDQKPSAAPQREASSPEALPRRRYQSERQRHRRATILEAVRAAITESGYDGMTMRGLAEAAGVSPKTLYNIYGSKDELLLAAVVDLLSEVNRLVPQSGTSVVSRILKRHDAISKEIQRNPRYAQAITQALLQARPGDRLVDLLLEAPARSIEQQLKEETPTPLARGIDARALSRMLSSQGWAMLMLWSKGVMSLSEATEQRRRSLAMALSGALVRKELPAVVAWSRERSK